MHASLHLVITSATILLTLSACGSGPNPLPSNKVSNERGSSSLSSGCTLQLVAENDGCGSTDHGPMGDDAQVATIKNSNGTTGPVQGTEPAKNPVVGGTAATPVPTTAATPPASNIVEFHIAPGTGAAPWNSMAQMIVIPVGKTLRIINDDAVVHRMHTPGRPCPHQPANMAPGGKYDCVISEAFDPGTNAPLYDHNDGQAVAPFWVKAVP